MRRIGSAGRLDSVCLPQVLCRPSDHLPRARRALDGAAAGLNVVENVGAQAEGVGWARALCLAQWTGALGAAMCLRMRASVGHAFARSLRDSLRPRDHVHVGWSGQFRPIWAKRHRLQSSLLCQAPRPADSCRFRVDFMQIRVDFKSAKSTRIKVCYA